MTEPITPKTFTKFEFLSHPKLSPDNRHVAFLAKKANEELDGYNSNIWLYSFSEDRTSQLTTSGYDGKFVWQDKETILFASERAEPEEEKEETDFYTIDISGGEAKQKFSVPHRVEEFHWHREGLIYRALTSVEEEDPEEEDKEQQNYRVLDEIPFWMNEQGFTNKKRQHLFSFNPQEEKDIELTPGYLSVGEFSFCEGRICFIGAEYKDKMPVTNDIYCLDLSKETTQPERLTGGERQFFLIEFRDDSNLFVSSTDMEEIGLNENHQLYNFNLKTRELELLNEEWKNSTTNRVLTDARLGGGPQSIGSREKMYFASTIGNHSHLLSVDSSGEITQLTSSSGSVDSFDVKEDRVVFVKLKKEELQELYTLGQDNQQEKALSRRNKQALDDLPLADVEEFTVENDGAQIEAWLMTPPDFDRHSSYPAILEIHGGPKTVYGEVYFHEMQLLASKGYVVLFSNPRGSDGKGDAFADIRGQFGDVDYRDLMAVLDQALRKYPFIDPDRLGVTGGSYGGFMTNWIIGHTDRFKAAVSCRSISNWISKFCTTDIGYYFVEDQQDGTPWNSQEKLWEQSPLQYADQADTPTLFIHSEEDYRCWLAEALQMFTALKYFGVEAKLCLFEGENHDLSRSGTPSNRIDRLDEMVTWFDKYLK